MDTEHGNDHEHGNEHEHLTTEHVNTNTEIKAEQEHCTAEMPKH